MMASKLTHIRSFAKVVGWPMAISTIARRVLKQKAARSISIHRHKLIMRPCDSDLFVAGQIFGIEEYNLGIYQNGLLDISKEWIKSGIMPVILDIGANVGYSALYFADKFPECTVIAVEADHATYQVLQANVRNHPRIIPLEAAVWDHERGVDIFQSARLGSWAGRVGNGVGLTKSMFLASTYKDVPNARPLIVKLDVEGAEKQITKQAIDVLSDVPCILIEPHDFMLPGEAVLSPLFEVLGNRRMDTILRDEVIMFFESAIAPRSSAA